MKWTVPNVLTIFRAALVPVFVLAFFSANRIIALPVFIIASITDVLDGYIARRTGVETPFGRWADPLADKLMTVAATTCLSVAGILPWCFPVAYGVIAVMMGVGAIHAYFGKKRIEVVKSNFVGKAAMGGTFFGICLSFFSGQVFPWHIVVIWIGITTSIASLVCYFVLYRKKVRELSKNAV
ncbi:MAG: CDP-alcohol phosphatidyltransferase family protein [Candidatus Colwellbacteria bacterium]|nr:CDP-alcohol phosphatidyltransferase family protein [Candidatus Colwellbacteria bacterium]